MTTTVLQPFDDLLANAHKTYADRFGVTADIAVCAPGRVNLIGEHVDYNDGFVLPIALPMVTVIVGSRNTTDSIADVVTTCAGADKPHEVDFDLTALDKEIKPSWIQYVKGVAAHFGHKIPGFNAVVTSNVPMGGGLSSSAALEVATLTFLEALTGHQIESKKRKALICQKAEHTFAGVPCGIMDQLISVMGEKDNALLIDCRSLDTFQIKFNANDLTVLICNSNVRHKLGDGEYAKRRAECSRALRLMGLTSYRDATIKHLDALKSENATLTKRARHVITEIQRTTDAAEALKRGDFDKMGQLMVASHESLRDDFQVSCSELDILVDAAMQCGDSVLGARMTGGGFGGCAVMLVKTDAVCDVVKHINDIYQSAKRNASFYTAVPSDGARVLTL